MSRAISFRSSSSPKLTQTTAPPANGVAGVIPDDDDGTVKEHYAEESSPDADRELREALYAAGAGKGSLCKLTPRKDWPATLIQLRMRHWLGENHLIDRVVPERIWKAAHAKGWTAIEVCAAVDEKGPLCRTKLRPVGFLETAVTNLLEPSVLEQIRKRTADRRAQDQADREREEARIADQCVADAQEAAFEACWSGMPDEDREHRIGRSLKRLAQEAIDAGPARSRDSRAMSALQRWQDLTPEMKRTRGEASARHELREEMNSEASAKGGA